MNKRQRFASFMVRHRWLALALMLLMTLGLGYGLKFVESKTVFSDLFPKTHPFVETYKDHPNFGNPLTLTIMVKRTDGGSVYSEDTLQKVWDISREIDLTPGVDHDQIISIATEKARYTALTADGIFSNPIMDDSPPKTAEEIAEVRRRVNESAFARGFLVSEDEVATLVNATFIERLVDYGVVFDHVQVLVDKYADENHEIHVAGWPMLTGWVYFFGDQTMMIFAVTVALMIICMVLAVRNVAGVVAPIIVSAVSAIWGFGFVGWIHHPVEPLLMVVPLLLVARSFSHCVQATERYYELLEKVGDKRKAAELSLTVMVWPGTLGIITDAAGLFLVGIAPIPAMERFALFTGFWALALIPTSVILTPILLTMLPTPKNLHHVVKTMDNGGMAGGVVQRLLNAVLLTFAKFTQGTRAKFTSIAFVFVAIFSVYQMFQIQVGNPVEGSNLLFEESEFNTAVREVNDHFPGAMTLELVIEGKDGRVVKKSDTLATMRNLQRCLESAPDAPTASLSFSDYAVEANRLFNGGNPKWAVIDRDDRSAAAAGSALMLGTSATAFIHVTDFEQENATVSLWYENNKQHTVDNALEETRKCIDEQKADHDAFLIRLASGSIALQQSINETVDLYQWFILGGLNLVIAIVCASAYGSLWASLILLIPVNLANAILTAIMTLSGMGLDVNSLPILAVGIGIGIDYGIYMLSRICEEYEHCEDFGEAGKESLVTCGKAILFTASLMIIGIFPWYFLSELKFLSDMGLMLVQVMIINMVLSLTLVPLLVYMLKPKFVQKPQHATSENIDQLVDTPM